MTENGSFEEDILSRFDQQLREDDTISPRVASILEESYGQSNFGDDEDLLEKLEEAIGDE